MKNIAKDIVLTKLSKFECQNYLSQYETELQYINQVNSVEDPQSLVRAISVVVRARGMSHIAKKTKLSRDGLYKAFSHNGNPSLTTVVRVLRGLGYQLKVISLK